MSAVRLGPGTHRATRTAACRRPGPAARGGAINAEFRERYLSRPGDPGAFEGKAIVFEGPEDYHRRINDPSLAIDADCILFIRNCGPLGYPGSAEVVNMQPPDALLKKGITSLPTCGDGRQSGTSASASILDASPEAAAGGGLALLQTGDRVRVDLNKRRVDTLVPDEELARRSWSSSAETPGTRTDGRVRVGDHRRHECLPVFG